MMRAVSILLLLCATGCELVFTLREPADAGLDVPPPDVVDAPDLRKVIFVTSTLHRGDFGGLDAADVICQGLAGRANLGGQFVAWLSDDNVSASSRMSMIGGYRTTTGITISTTYADFIDGSLDHPIDADENGQPAPDTGTTCIGGVWTSSGADGAKANMGSCDNWLTSLSGEKAVAGSTQFDNLGWTASCLFASCDETLSLYCVEQ